MEQQHYFLIETKLGKTYVTKLHGEENLKLNIDKIDDQEVLTDFSYLHNSKFITLEDPIVMVPQRGQDGRVQTIPIRISEAPMGSTRVVMAVDIIAEINVIDNGSDFVTKLRAQEAGLYVGGSTADAEKSSAVIHKFSKR